MIDLSHAVVPLKEVDGKPELGVFGGCSGGGRCGGCSGGGCNGGCSGGCVGEGVCSKDLERTTVSLEAKALVEPNESRSVSDVDPSKMSPNLSVTELVWCVSTSEVLLLTVDPSSIHCNGSSIHWCEFWLVPNMLRREELVTV